MISRLAKTTLSYLFMAAAMLALVLTTQVIFEWTTARLKWTTAAAFSGSTLLAATLHYLMQLCRTQDSEIGAGATRREHVRSFQYLGIAASLAIGVAIAFVAQKYLQPEETVITGASQWHHMTLPDGTVIAVDAHSEIEVAYTPDQRIVHVHRGGAVFKVAPDLKRPFIARTNIIDAVAVGTRFGVSIGSYVATTVSEGVVKVTVRDTPDAVGVILEAGEEFRIPVSSLTLPHVAKVDAERKLMWATGQLILSGLTVAEGVAELNRRNRTQIVIDSPALGKRVVDFASVKVDAPETYAKVVARERGVTMTVDLKNDVIRLSE